MSHPPSSSPPAVLQRAKQVGASASETFQRQVPPGAPRTIVAVLATLLSLSTVTRQVKPALLAVMIQYVVFVAHALPNKSELLYDLSGALTHITLVMYTLLKRTHTSTRATINSMTSILWASRLGTFLFLRIVRDGGVDHRFDSFKHVSRAAFMQAWTMQAFWCWIVELPVLVSNSSKEEIDVPINKRDLLGWALWMTGFALEAVADAQKNAFQFNPENRGKFIDVGLWHSFSRHPNMAGEILQWIGTCLSASNVFRAWSTDYLAMLSPLFTYILLTRVSGIPMLERAAEKKWGQLAAYRSYVDKTPVLFPLIT